MVNYPDDWKRKQLKDIGYIQMCRRIFQHQTSTSGEIPFYKISTFGGKADVYITRKLYEEYRDKYPYPQKGDILLSAAGTIGRTVIFNGEDAYFQDSNIVWLNVNKKFIDTRYLYWFYLSNPWHSLEGTTIQRLYNKTILDTEIYLPPIPEQTAIATALSDMDSLIDSLRQLIAKKKNIRQGAMQELLTGKRRLPGFEGEWRETLLYDVADRFDNLRVPISADKRVRGYTPYYGANGIQDYVNGYTHNGEYVLIAEDGANDLQHYPIRYVCGKIWANNHVHVLQGKHNVIYTKFLSYVLTCVNFESILVGGTRAKLNAKSLMRIKIYIPVKVKEQQAISETIYDMELEISALQTQLQKYENIKKGMMEKLLTGQIRLV